MQTDPTSLFVVPEGVQTRWATSENPRAVRGGACRDNDGRKRASHIKPLKAGDSVTIAEVSGASGLVRRMWVTIFDRSPKMLRGMRLDIFWDGAATPAVSAPLGDFFCQSLGRMTPFENAFFSSPEGRSFNACVPMPFQTAMRMVVTNETDVDQGRFFYEVDYTIGDIHPPGTLYFHAHWRRENPTTAQKDFEILPRLRGRGRYFGASLGVIGNTSLYRRSWWGEGEVKVFLDGDTGCPTLCGTGTEDYIGTGWCLGWYANAFQGCHLADSDKFQYGFYRLHLPDPVYFRQEIRVTIQQIGWWDTKELLAMPASERPSLFRGNVPVDPAAQEAAGEGALFEREDDWSSCAYFALDRPENALPPLAPWRERVKGLTE